MHAVNAIYWLACDQTLIASVIWTDQHDTKRDEQINLINNSALSIWDDT